MRAHGLRFPRPIGRLLVACAAAFAFSCAARHTERPAVQPTPPSTTELIKQADELYTRREDLDRVREGIVQLRLARLADERSYEVLWKLAKLSHYLGENSANKGERDAAYSEGITAGHAAVEIDSSRPEGHFWLGENLAGRTKVQGVIGDLAAAGDVRREMEAVARVDEGFERGGVFLLLAEMELGLPRVLGGDKKRAVELLERGLTYGGDNARLRLRLAQAYLAVKRREDARTQLQTILTMEPPPDYLPEHKKAVAEAELLLKEEFEKRAR